MSNHHRLISIIIATHERPQLLTRTLDSVAKQTYPPGEVVIVDDGSGPATKEALRHWKAKAKPSFDVHYYWQENQGPATARNRGVEASKGELVQFLDDDDLMCPDALGHLARALDGVQKGVAMAAYQHWENGNPAGAEFSPKPVSSHDTLQAMISGTWFVPIHGYLFTRSALQHIGPWNPALTSQEDDELLLRAAMAQISFHPAPRAKVYYCRHAGPRRATPGKPGEAVVQGLKKRMLADLAIRESAFETLSRQGDIERYRIPFALWHMRLRKRYSNLLHELECENELLEWLASTVEEEGGDSDTPPPLASI